MGYSTLKAALDAVVRTNGQQQITGANLNGVMTTLLQGVDILDRANPADTSGLNKIVLDKSKTFAEQVTGTNTIYEIRDAFDLGGNSVTIPAGSILDFKGGFLSNGTLNGNNTLILADGLCIKKNVVIGGTWANHEIFTKWLEFVSSQDGTTDNTICFKQLQALINGTRGCRVTFTKGYYQTKIVDNDPEDYVVVDGVTYPKWAMDTYQVDGRVVLNIFELPFLEINLNGSTIKAIGIACPGWNMIRLNGVEMSYVHDGELIGMADGFTYPDYVNYSGSVKNNYEFSLLLTQIGGFCHVSNVNCKYSTGDGITAGSGYWYFVAGDVRPSGVVVANEQVNFPAKGYCISDCEVSYCGRNGVTLRSSEFGKLERCHIHHIGSDGGNGVIGSDGILGRNPRSGIDVEFEDGIGLKPIMQWDSLNIHDCGGKSHVFDASGVMSNFQASNCRFIGLGVTNVMTADGAKEYLNCYMEHSSGDQGNLYGHDIVFRDCQIVVKRKGLMVGSNTFINCTITDGITAQLSSTEYVFIQDARKDAIFRNCTITILSGHPYGYMQNWKLYGCTLNFYHNGSINSCGIEFYDCDFHNDPEDTSGKSFYFLRGNYPDQTRGHFWFVNCSFDRLNGTQTSVGEYAINGGSYPVVFDRCKFENLAFCNGSYSNDITIKNSEINYIYIRSYQDADTKGVRIENCTILNYNSGQSRNVPVEITRSKVEIIAGGTYKLYKANFKFSEIINNVTRGGYLDDGVNAEKSILDFVASTATANFNLVDCYVKGQVTEATFAGTKKNCTFES